MRQLSKNNLFFLTVGFCLLWLSGVAQAQSSGVGSWPTQKPIRLIVVFPAGGSGDWSCPYKTGHSACATSRINSLGDFSFNPL